MKPLQQNTLHAGAQPQVSGNEQRRELCSTAAILARGVSLTQVQQAVKKLRPQVQQVG